MPFEIMAHKFERIPKAAGFLRYMLMEEHDAHKEVVANLGKNWRHMYHRCPA